MAAGKAELEAQQSTALAELEAELSGEMSTEDAETPSSPTPGDPDSDGWLQVAGEWRQSPNYLASHSGRGVWCILDISVDPPAVVAGLEKLDKKGVAEFMDAQRAEWEVDNPAKS